jgi:isopenicillin N synthase-like dioxygenase
MSDLQHRTREGLNRGDLSAAVVDFDQIPLIDLSDLGNADVGRRREVAHKIRAACERVGFLYVIHHGVAQGLLDAVFDSSREFFALPSAEKLAYDINRGTRHRGYCARGTLNADINNPDAVDLQEAFEVSLELPADDPDYLAGNPMYGPNLWPAAPAAFKPRVNAYVEEMIRVGRLLFRGFALALGLDEHWFEDKISKPMAQLRLIHYPPQPPGPIDASSIGIGAHTDYECFTILAQTAEGLQVRNAAGRWINAPPVPGALLINIGDCLERWTNDRFRSTLHRVVNLSGGDRYSLAFFFGADFQATIQCLPTCQDADRPARYPPVLAGEWTVRNIQAAYTYRPSLP